jgi:hypothetical protein
MLGLEDFDRYCEEHDVQPGQYGAAFAQARQTSRTRAGAGRKWPGQLPNPIGCTHPGRGSEPRP